MHKSAKPILRLVLASIIIYHSGAYAAEQAMSSLIRFKTRVETLKQLLPATEVVTQRDITLTEIQRRKLKKLKNWNTDEVDFTIYHAKNKEEKIVRTVILFPEYTRQGMIMVAVGLSNQGEVVEALVMEAENTVSEWLLPLLRSGYMETFSGKGKDLKLELDKKFTASPFTPITRTYALHIANAVKKSAQLFNVVFIKK